MQHQEAQSQAAGQRGRLRRGSVMRSDIKTENRVTMIKVPTGDRTFWRADKVLCQMASSKVGDGDLVCQVQAGLGGDVRQAGRKAAVSEVSQDEVKQQVRAATSSGVLAWRPECPPWEAGPATMQ